MKKIELDHKRQRLKYTIFKIDKYHKDSDGNDIHIGYLTHKGNVYKDKQYTFKNIFKLIKTGMYEIQELKDIEYVDPRFFIRILAASDTERKCMDDKPNVACKTVSGVCFVYRLIVICFDFCLHCYVS